MYINQVRKSITVKKKQNKINIAQWIVNICTHHLFEQDWETVPAYMSYLVVKWVVCLWQKPAATCPAPGDETKSVPLPQGWRCYMSPEGCRYYVNTGSKGKPGTQLHHNPTDMLTHVRGGSILWGGWKKSGRSSTPIGCDSPSASTIDFYNAPLTMYI